MSELFGSALLVEDEALVALMIEDMLAELGINVIASVAQLGKASEVAASADFDVAILDVNLAGELVFPVARILRGRGVPFLFSTGYGEPSLDDEFRNAPAIAKPFSAVQLGDKLRELIYQR